MQPTDTPDPHKRAREEHQEHVVLQPRSCSVWVTPCCGPDGNMVMIDMFDGGTSHHFLSGAEAMMVSGAIRRAAWVTLKAAGDVQ